MQKIDGKKTTIYFTNEQITQLDRIAKKAGKTRSDIIRLMLDVGLAGYRDFEAVGMIDLALFVQKMKKLRRKEVGQQELFT